MCKTHITVLTGQKPSIKSYAIVDDIAKKGKAKTSYLFDYVTHTVSNIDELYTVIKETSLNDKGIIIRGKADQNQGVRVRRTLQDESRSKGTFHDAATAWICIDFDDRIAPNKFNRLSLDAVEWLIEQHLPAEFHDVTYIYQWSASASLEYNGAPIKSGTNVHLFFYLDKGLLQPEFRGWFQDNSDIDRSVFGIVQPIFVNANIDKDERIVDLIPADRKIGLIRKSQDVVTTPENEQLEHFRKKYSRKAASIDGESSNAIIQKLYDVGCVTNQSPNTLSLKSPYEKTQGGYYTKIDNPKWIHHNAKDSRRVDQWLREEWEIEFKIPSEDYSSLAERFKHNYNQQPRNATFDEAFSINEPLYAEAYNRNKRHALTQKAYQHWKQLNRNVKMLLYAFEGFGKSRIVHVLVQDRRKVVFACKTNQQAEEQYSKFTDQGLRAQLLLSREYQLAKLGFSECVIKEPRRHPWDTAAISKTATVARLQQTGLTKEEAEAVWVSTGTEKINCVDYDVVVMTHARLALIGFIQEQKRARQQIDGTHDEWLDKIPSNADCVWDDVDRKDFAWLSPFDNQYANVEINGRLIERKSFKKTAKNRQEYEIHYFIKPECFRYGYGLPNRQIFTTTEQLTTFLIERHIGVDNLFVPELMPTIKMKAGDITVFKTNITSRNRDGLLLPLLRRVQKEGYDFYVIGDSISPINHTNNKGQNCYDDKDIVVEVSQMNMMDIPQWLDELGWSEKETHALKVVDAMDRFHQAIGRNSGYRWSDKDDANKKSVVVLMDGGIFEGVINQSRYYIDHTEDLDSPVDAYRKRDRNNLTACVAWYIQNLDTYINATNIAQGDRKSFERDCLFVVKNNEQKFVDRMKKALEHLSQTTTNRRTKSTISAVLKKLA
ncbi:MAG: hypothetical protein ACXWF8_05375 [Methylobacter sp.]